MANPVIMQVPRAIRRMALRDEARHRTAGEWGPWETLRFPKGSAGNGWAGEFDRVHRNRVFSVLDRTLPDGTRHLMVSSLSEERPSWWEAQRIKNEIAGPDATAVEVYPPQAEVVDDANAYHLWVLTAPLSFGLRAPAPSAQEGR